jgi:hypothetical protein
MDSDPAILSESGSGSGTRVFDDRQLKKIQLKKIDLYASLKDVQSIGEASQPSKENILHFTKLNLITFFLFLWVIFPLLDPDPILIQIHNTAPFGHLLDGRFMFAS